jgi:hypothetical protein
MRRGGCDRERISHARAVIDYTLGFLSLLLQHIFMEAQEPIEWRVVAVTALRICSESWQSNFIITSCTNDERLYTEQRGNIHRIDSRSFCLELQMERGNRKRAG